MQQVAIVYMQFQNCARDAQFRNRPGKLATANLRNAISKLGKLLKSVEHILYGGLKSLPPRVRL